MRIKKGLNKKKPEVGKIKIGMKDPKSRRSANDKEWHAPRKLNHFIVVRPDRDREKVNYLLDEKVMGALGDAPKEIPIILPFDDPDMNFQTSFAYYAGRECLCRGDGETAEMLFMKDGKPQKFTLLDQPETVHKNERRKIVCDYESCPIAQAGKCKPTGRLICIIPASERLNGYYFFRTTSWNTISYITDALDDMKQQAGGILRGLPCKLFFFQKATESHGNVPVVSIDWDFSDMQKLYRLAESEKKNRIDFGVNMAQIEDRARQSGILDDTDEPEEVVKEFYPEQSEEYQKKREEEKSSIISRSDAILADVEDVEIEEDEIEQPEEDPVEQEEIEEPEKKEDLDLFS